MARVSREKDERAPGKESGAAEEWADYYCI